MPSAKASKILPDRSLRCRNESGAAGKDLTFEMKDWLAPLISFSRPFRSRRCLIPGVGGS